MKKLLSELYGPYFNADGSGGGGGNPPANPEPPKNDPPNDPPKKLEMTQDELDKIISERISRERKKFEGFDDLKNKVSEYEKQLEEKRLAELSEQERIKEIAKKAEEEKDKLAKELEDVRKQTQHQRIVHEFTKVALQKNVGYIDDAIKLADLSKVSVEGDEIKGVAEAVDELIKARPFLLTKPAPQKPGTIGSSTAPQGPTDKTPRAMLDELAEKARKSGRAEDKVAYVKLKRELGIK